MEEFHSDSWTQHGAGGNNQPQLSDNRPPYNATKQMLVLCHGILMAFVWLFAVPVAMGGLIYARKKNKTWGVKLHMSVMALAAFIPFTISAVLAFSVAGKIKIKPHSIIGTILTVGAWIQVMLGMGNHLLFKYRVRMNCVPKTRPWNNHVHIWLGRTLMILALVNIPLGLRIKRAHLAFFIAYALWLTIIAVFFLYLMYMKQEGPKVDAVIDEKTTTKQETQKNVVVS